MYPPSSNTEELDVEMHTFGLLNTTKVHPRAVVHTGKRKTNPMLVPYTPVLLVVNLVSGGRQPCMRDMQDPYYVVHFVQSRY